MNLRLCLSIALIATAHAADPSSAPSYAKDIAPVFSERCAGCHLGKVKMGGLSLETYDGLMQGGSTGKVVIPGRGKDSRLYLLINGDISPAMPMNSTRLPLEQIDTIRRWIDAGANGPGPGEVATPLAPVALAPIAPKGNLRPQIFDLAYSPDGKTVALAGFKTVRVLDLSTKQPAAVVAGHADTVRAIAFSPDGTLLAAAGGLPARSGEVIIWDVRQHKLLRKIKGHADCVYGIAFSPDGKSIATSSYDKLIKLWDVDSGNEIRTFKDHIDAIYALAFTPDGKRLISGAADRTVKIWNVSTGERLYTLSDPQDGINALAIDPSGKYVAAGGQDKSIRIWELGEKSGRLVHSLIAHEDAILRLAWSPDGTKLLSSSADRTVKLFNASDLSELNAYPESDWVYGLKWAPDGKSFAVGRFDGTWDTATPTSKAVATASR